MKFHLFDDGFREGISNPLTAWMLWLKYAEAGKLGGRYTLKDAVCIDAKKANINIQ